jgi:hypothetical protein
MRTLNVKASVEWGIEKLGFESRYGGAWSDGRVVCRAVVSRFHQIIPAERRETMSNERSFQASHTHSSSN